jgi:hypothetical protein
LAVPHCGQDSAGAGGCSGAAAVVLAEAPILIPQTSQKSMAADV